MTVLTLLANKWAKRRVGRSRARKLRNRLPSIESTLAEHQQLQTLADELAQEVRRDRVIEFEAERIRRDMQVQIDAQRDAEIGIRMRRVLNQRNEVALMTILAAA